MDKFLSVLAEFEQLGGAGIVYGGCLRDTICRVGPVKDIDIAVENTPDTLKAIEAFVYSSPDTQRVEQMIGYGNFPDVYKSVQVARPADLLVNFVVLGREVPFTKPDVAGRCDFGICQAALDKDGLWTSEAFERDRLHYTFTYLRDPFDEAQLARSLRRWDRLSEKFVGWRLEVPGRPEKLVGRRADVDLVDEIAETFP